MLATHHELYLTPESTSNGTVRQRANMCAYSGCLQTVPPVTGSTSRPSSVHVPVPPLPLRFPIWHPCIVSASVLVRLRLHTSTPWGCYSPAQLVEASLVTVAEWSALTERRDMEYRTHADASAT